VSAGSALAPSAFELSETERMVRETADAALASFGDNVALVALEGSELGYDPAVWARMTQLGWPGFVMPEPAGGDGSMLEVGQLIEAVGWAAYPSPLLQATSAAVLLAEHAPGCALAHQVAGGAIVAAAVPVAETVLRFEGGRLTGPAVVIEWAPAAEALLVLAQSGEGWALVSVTGDALRGRVTPARSLDNERIGIVELDGFGGGAVVSLVDHADGTRAVDLIRLLRAAEMAGGAARTLALTQDYMLERHQFGVPLGSFQAVQQHLANMRIDVDAALLCTREGLSLAELRRPIAASAAIAGYVAGRTYARTTVTAAQLFAGIGAVKEHRLHHHFRRAKSMQLRLGSVPSQLRRVTQAAIVGAPPGPWRA
jgi:alkylation response protein AidB-like acyl-CoA dehydrogenase